MMGANKGQGGMMGMHGGQGGMMMGQAMMSAVARTEPIEGGARIVFSTKDEQAIGDLRSQARMHAQGMGSGGCPMMAMQGGTAPGSP